MQGNSLEKFDYPTQKPESLLTRIIQASSNQGNIVADFFCGSGTTAFIAEQWGRRWVTCDTSRVAITLAKQRLMTSLQKENPQKVRIRTNGEHGEFQRCYASTLGLTISPECDVFPCQGVASQKGD